MELQGLRIAITGGTSGLGLALVREFFRRGAHVAFVARTREQVERVAREHPGAHGIVGDVANKNDIYPIALQITANPSCEGVLRPKTRSWLTCLSAICRFGRASSTPKPQAFNLARKAGQG